MHKQHYIYFVGLMELFQGVRELEKYRIKLALQHVIFNENRKIWVLIDDMYDFK